MFQDFTICVHKHGYKVPQWRGDECGEGKVFWMPAILADWRDRFVESLTAVLDMSRLVS